MTEKLEDKAKSYKMKGWEMAVPVIGTSAYYIRCIGKTPSQDIIYQNESWARFAGLITRDVFLASAAAMAYLFMN